MCVGVFSCKKSPCSGPVPGPSSGPRASVRASLLVSASPLLRFSALLFFFPSFLFLSTTMSISSSSSSSSSFSVVSQTDGAAIATAAAIKRAKNKRRKEKHRANKRKGDAERQEQAAAKRQATEAAVFPSGPSAKALARQRRRARCDWRAKQLAKKRPLFCFLGEAAVLDVIDLTGSDDEDSDFAIVSDDRASPNGSTVITGVANGFAESDGMVVEEEDAESQPVQPQKMLHVKDSSLGKMAGKGVFALCTIPSGTVLLPYLGEELDEAAFMERFHVDAKGDAHRNKEAYRYVLELPGKRWIDAFDEKMANESRFVNHNLSKRCNCRFTWNGKLQSTRIIHAGEELFVSYAPWFTAYLKRRKHIVFHTDAEFKAIKDSCISKAASK